MRKWYVRTLVEFLASKNLCLQNCDLHVLLYQYIVKLLQRGREVCAVQVIVLGLQDALGLPDKVPVPNQLSAKAAIGVSVSHVFDDVRIVILASFDIFHLVDCTAVCWSRARMTRKTFKQPSPRASETIKTKWKLGQCHIISEPPTNTDSSVFIRILKLITDAKLRKTDD